MENKFKRGITPKKALNIGIREYHKENIDMLLKNFEKIGIGKIHSIGEMPNDIFVDFPIQSISKALKARNKTIKWFKENTYYYIISGVEFGTAYMGDEFKYRRYKFNWILKESLDELGGSILNSNK